MMIATMQSMHIETYHYYFKRNTEECRNGKTKKTDVHNVTVFGERKRWIYQQ